MKKYILLIFIILLLTVLICSKNKSKDTCCEVEFVLIPKQQLIPIYKDYKNHVVINSILNDTISENYFIGVIYEIKNNFSRIKGSYVFGEEIIEGWIKTEHLGIYLSDFLNVSLYSKPFYSSKKWILKNPEWYPIPIIKCKNNWVYVKYIDSHQKKSGWIPPEHQSSNPYTISN